MPVIETIAVIGIVALALIFTARKFARIARGEDGCNCEGSCPLATPDECQTTTQKNTDVKESI